ncbi:hypothetical protein AVEN_178574-1 [Araneus ventricosus]|uniref:Uncharacterized protein n=1 Tax=Araneus ventricosus TaxID=182803 RepID=A0A4Y2FLT8_ARAVE|nr:hypothetical protein AVEN_178574-1 [Araneus ventricosus]
MRVLAFHIHFYVVAVREYERGGGGLMVRLWLSGPEGVKVRNPIPLKVCCVWRLLHFKSILMVKHHPAGAYGSMERGLPAQLSSSSSDRGSRLRGSPQNIPRVASK